MNTKSQVDELFEEIIQNKNSIVNRTFEYDSLLKIRKLKLQLYFKKKFAELLKAGIIKYPSPIKNVCLKINGNAPTFPVLDILKLEKLNILEIADIIKRKPSYVLRLLSKNNISIQSFHDYLQIADLKRIYPIFNQIYQKQFQVRHKKSLSRNTIVLKEVDLSINDICDKSIKEVSIYLSHSQKYMIQKISHLLPNTNINEDFILTSNIIKLLYDYLNNLFHIKNKKDQKEDLTDIVWASKRKYEKFKPSLGKEGNYRKLIYIRTKS